MPLADSEKQGNLPGPTLDQLLARDLPMQTPYRSLEVGVQNLPTCLSHAAGGGRMPVESNPVALFEGLFGRAFSAPDVTPGQREAWRLRGSVLDAVDEGDGTLLDHCGILATTDCSYGRSHSIDDHLILVAGSMGGRLKTGLHYRSTMGENAARVSLTLARAMGAEWRSFGNEDCYTESGLSALEA
jgi:hypothetical protein